MRLTVFIACVNVLSLILSYILLFNILKKTTMKWRYIYLGVLLFCSVFRSIFVAADLGHISIENIETYTVDFKCTLKAILNISSHYVRIIGLPLFVLATFIIILRNYKSSQINRLYLWLTVIFMSSLVFISFYYFLRKRIENDFGFCYLDNEGTTFIANLNIAVTVLSIISILGLSVIIYKKKRITANTKYLVLASMYYSIIPLMSFFVYFLYLVKVNQGLHLHAYQRISTFMIFLGVLLFERKTSNKKRDVLLKWLLGFRDLRNLYKKWLDNNNFRKDHMAIELYEHIEENEHQIEKINIEDYQRLFVESVQIETEDDVSKIKSDLIESLNSKYGLFKKSNEYELAQKIYENTLDSDIALLDN